MEFIPLYCHIPHESGKKAQYLCDVEAGVAIELRFTCRHKHPQGHTGRIKFNIDKFGNVVWEEMSNETDKKYFNDGVRIGGGGD